MYRVRSSTGRGTFPLCLLALTAAQPTVAQRLAQLSPSVPLSQTYSGPSQSLTRGLVYASSPSPTYWLEGGLIGAGLVGTMTVLWASSMCESRCSSVGGKTVEFALGAGLGFSVGAIIGGQFHKHRSPPP